MIVRATSQIFDNFFLLTLGHSCHYVIGDANGYALIDPGCTSHIPSLIRRLTEFGLPPKNLRYVLLTHLHAHRMGGVAALRRYAPNMKLFGSPLMQSRVASSDFLKQLYKEDLALTDLFSAHEASESTSFDEFERGVQFDKKIVESELIEIDEDISLRVVNTPGHTAESLSYLLVPFQVLLTDETFGYFRGRKLVAPGGDFSVTRAVQSVSRFGNLEISGLALPYGGYLTGSLVRKHLTQVVQNTTDVINEVRRATKEGMSDEEIRVSVRDGFYATESTDPLVHDSMSRSFSALWDQLIVLRNEEPSPAPAAQVSVEGSSSDLPPLASSEES